MQNKSREKQNTHTDAEIQTPKHESTSTNSLKKIKTTKKNNKDLRLLP